MTQGLAKSIAQARTDRETNMIAKVIHHSQKYTFKIKHKINRTNKKCERYQGEFNSVKRKTYVMTTITNTWLKQAYTPVGESYSLLATL